ncbi:MAG: hypothetical protein NVS3B17_02160 [Vulcanimicrobiaceae bacterium]
MGSASSIVRATLRPLVASSRLRLASLETRGTASILVGVAAIVLARGTSSALARAATALPESLHEARLLWLTLRASRTELAAALQTAEAPTRA